MNLSKLRELIDSTIRNGECFDDVLAMLRDYKEKGVEQAEVLILLESMRVHADDEYEDEILEILDIVTGCCQSRYRIW